MADTKWISGLDAKMPVTQAAQRVLSVRLGHVLERLPAPVDHADEDVEHVHQLRVGTRRAAAAVRIFADALGTSLHRRVRRTLKAIRRGAGAARDWDVFLETINSRLRRRTAAQQAGLDFLLGFGQGQRTAAQQDLGQATEGQSDKLKRLMDEIAQPLDTSAGSQT